MAQLLLLTLRGTPTCYYGDELGLMDVEIPPDKLQDPAGLQQPGVKGVGRDPERTPMQWDAGPNAGFCAPGVEPWLPVAPDYQAHNVAREEQDSRSLLTLFRRLTALRRATPALYSGSYESYPLDAVPVLAYTRRHAQERVLIALNFGDTAQLLNFGQLGGQGRVLLSTELDREGAEDLAQFQLRAHEGVIVEPG